MGRRPGGKNKTRISMNGTPDVKIVNGEVVVTAPVEEEKPLAFSVDSERQSETRNLEVEKKPEGEIPGFGNDECNGILDALSMIESGVASRLYGIPPEITSQAFEFDDYYRKKLNPPMSRILNKWAPVLIKNWKDEIGFGIIFLSVVNAQVKKMHTLEEKRKRGLPAATPKPAITSISDAQPKKEEPKTQPSQEIPDLLDNVGFNL